MKNGAGIIIGFVLGLAGFLYMFKVLILVNIPPEDELAPGIVVLAAIINGVFFSYVGYRVQEFFGKKSV